MSRTTNEYHDYQLMLANGAKLQEVLDLYRQEWAEEIREVARDIEDQTDTSNAPYGMFIAANMLSYEGGEQ